MNTNTRIEEEENGQYIPTYEYYFYEEEHEEEETFSMPLFTRPQLS